MTSVQPERQQQLSHALGEHGALCRLLHEQVAGCDPGVRL